MVNKIGDDSIESGQQNTVGPDIKTIDSVSSTLGMKRQVLDEICGSDFPDLGFLLSEEVIPVFAEVFDELLKDFEGKFQILLSMNYESIRFADIPEFNYIECMYNLSSHSAQAIGTKNKQDAHGEIEKKFLSFREKIYQSKPYYELVCFLLKKEENPISLRVLELEKSKCEKSGIHLDNETKAQIEKIRDELTDLSKEFMQNIAEFRKNTTFTLSEEQLGDMPESFKLSAKAEADERGVEGFVFPFSVGNQGALCEYVSDQNLRRKVFLAGRNIAAKENSEIILKMLKLRKDYAEALGFDAYADYAIQGKMAQSKEQIIAMYKDSIAKYKASFEKDIREMCDYFGLDSMSEWDFKYYKTRYISETQKVDTEELQAYMNYENVLDGVFDVIEEVYGVKFERTNIPTYSEEVDVYVVSKGGKKLGYYMPDLFSRDGKRQGAWAEFLRKSFPGEKIMTNVGNIANTGGKKYFSMFDVKVIFHELGHMVHELLSPEEDNRLSGFEVETDAIEIPSMFFENLSVPYDFAKMYLKHEKTGESISRDVHKAFSRKIEFGSGYGNLRALYLALFDLEVHGTNPPESLSQLQSVMNHFYSSSMPFTGMQQQEDNLFASFHHLFYSATSMYAGGFYSYAWSDEMQKALWDKIQETGGPIQSPFMRRYIDIMLSGGASEESMKLYERVMNA